MDGISISSDAPGAAYVRGNAVWNAHNNGIEALVTEPYSGGGPATLVDDDGAPGEPDPAPRDEVLA